MSSVLDDFKAAANQILFRVQGFGYEIKHDGLRTASNFGAYCLKQKVPHGLATAAIGAFSFARIFEKDVKTAVVVSLVNYTILTIVKELTKPDPELVKKAQSRANTSMTIPSTTGSTTVKLSDFESCEVGPNPDKVAAIALTASSIFLLYMGQSVGLLAAIPLAATAYAGDKAREYFLKL